MVALTTVVFVPIEVDTVAIAVGPSISADTLSFGVARRVAWAGATGAATTIVAALSTCAIWLAAFARVREFHHSSASSLWRKTWAG